MMKRGRGERGRGGKEEDEGEERTVWGVIIERERGSPKDLDADPATLLINHLIQMNYIKPNNAPMCCATSNDLDGCSCDTSHVLTRTGLACEATALLRRPTLASPDIAKTLAFEEEEGR